MGRKHDAVVQAQQAARREAELADENAELRCGICGQALDPELEAAEGYLAGRAKQKRDENRPSARPAPAAVCQIACWSRETAVEAAEKAGVPRRRRLGRRSTLNTPARASAAVLAHISTFPPLLQCDATRAPGAGAASTASAGEQLPAAVRRRPCRPRFIHRGLAG